MENFERLSQRYGLVRKPDHSVNLGSTVSDGKFA